MKSINRSHAALVAGHALARLAEFCFLATVVYWGELQLFQRYDPMVRTVLTLSAVVTAVLVAPFAGVFVDRWDRHRTMLGATAACAVASASAAVLALLPAELLGAAPTFALAFVPLVLCVGAARFFGPARFAVIDRVVGAERRERAAVLSVAVALVVPALLGSVLAGVLWSSLGAGVSLLVDTGLFLAAFALVRTVRLRPADQTVPGPGVLSELAAGLGGALSSPVVRAVLAALLVLGLAGTVLSHLGGSFALEHLGAGAMDTGLLSLAFAVGLLAGALAMLFAGADHAWVLRSGLLLFGGGLVLLAWLGWVWAAMPVMLLLGVATAGVNCAVGPLLLTSVPGTHLGRAVGLVDALASLCGVVALLVTGGAATGAFGAVTAFTVLGLLTVATGAYLRLGLRSAGRPGVLPG